MNSVHKEIESKIKSFERGTVFFPDDFFGVGTYDNVRQSLKRLVESELIMRVAQGIYCYPEVDDLLGLGVLYPTYEEIAEAIARRSHARIVPTGDYALNVLGLSTQVPMNFVFLTDGPSRSVEALNGREITFKRVAPKKFVFKNRLAMLVNSALKSIKKENVTEKQIAQIERVLQKEDRDAVLADVKLMPAWIRNIVKKAYA